MENVLTEMGDMISHMPGPNGPATRDAFIAMAGMSGGPTGFVLEAGATAEANA